LQEVSQLHQVRERLSARFEVHKQIHIAGRAFFAPGARAEQSDAADPEPPDIGSMCLQLLDKPVCARMSYDSAITEGKLTRFTADFNEAICA